MKKLDYIPCLCVLNISSWQGISPDAEHVYGHLTLVKQNTDPDYGLITIDNIEEWRPDGEVIELQKPLTLADAKLLDEKSGGKTYQHSVMLSANYNKKTYSGRFNSVDEVTKFAIKTYKRMKLNCDFISLYQWERFNETMIIKAP